MPGMMDNSTIYESFLKLYNGDIENAKNQNDEVPHEEDVTLTLRMPPLSCLRGSKIHYGQILM
jgi:hypothetical protein